MNVLIFMIPISLALGGLFVFLCLKSLNDGQFDDLETPAQRILEHDRKENP